MTSFRSDSSGDSGETIGKVQVVISGGENNATEIVAGGAVNLKIPHADLRAALRHGFRFPLDIPPGAIVKPGAFIQFTASHDKGPAHVPNSGTCKALIQIEAADDAAALEKKEKAISARAYLPALEWSIEDDWSAGTRTSAQRTPDLSPLLQAIVDRPGFRRGKHILFMVSASTSSGVERAVAAFNHPHHGGASGAPELHAEWELRSEPSPKPRPFALAGFGAHATGGGEGPSKVFEVRSTADSGPDTLRQAIAEANDTNGTKEIRILTDGIIALERPGLPAICGSNITLTGHHAPGLHAVVGKPTWDGNLLSVTGNNILVEHMRFYWGTSALNGDQGRTLFVGGSKGPKAFRFCSFAFTTDQINAMKCSQTTFQYCLFFWPLNNNNHKEIDKNDRVLKYFAHPMGQQLGFSGDGVSSDDKNVTMDKCVCILEGERNPLRIHSGKAEIINCLTYGWNSDDGCVLTGEGAAVNAYSSKFMGASFTPDSRRPFAAGGSAPDACVHVTADCVWQRAGFSEHPGSDCLKGGSASAKWSPSPVAIGSPGQGTVIGVAELLQHLKPLVGAHLPVRSWIDQRVLDFLDAPWAKTGHDPAAVLIDQVFRANDGNTNPSANASTAPLADANGKGWQEALTGP